MSNPVRFTVASTECLILLRTPLGDHWFSAAEAYKVAICLEVEASKVMTRMRKALRGDPPFAGTQPAAQGGADGGFEGVARG